MNFNGGIIVERERERMLFKYISFFINVCYNNDMYCFLIFIDSEIIFVFG